MPPERNARRQEAQSTRHYARGLLIDAQASSSDKRVSIQRELEMQFS